MSENLLDIDTRLTALLNEPRPTLNRRAPAPAAETASGFWSGLTATRDASLGHTGPTSTTLPDGYTPPVDHSKHKGFNARAFARCAECATKKLRWGLAQPEYTHAGRNARRERDIRLDAGLPI